MIVVEIADADYRRVNEQLKMGPKATAAAIRAAVRRTIAPGATQLRRRVRETLSTSAAATRDVIVTRLAPSPGLFGEVVVKQKPIPLVSYKHSVSKRGGVRVQIFKNRPPLVLRFAFKQKMPRGVYIIAQRVRGKTKTKQGHVTASGRRVNIRGKLNAAGFTTFLPIKQNYGPSVRDLIAKDQVRPLGRETQQNLAQRFQRELDGQISRFLAGKNIGFLSAGAD